MADISGYVNTIKTAESGESVRNAIASAIEEVNKDSKINLVHGKRTTNGTSYAKDGTAFKSFTCAVSGGSQGSSLETFKVDENTENGTYDAEDNKLWNQIVVDIPDKFDRLGEVTLTEEGTFNALEKSGVDGWSKVTVKISGTPGGVGPTHTVTFMHNDTVLATIGGIPHGGGAFYDGPAPVESGKRFIGWNPSPNVVMNDMVCHAAFMNYDTYSVAEIRDTWDVIAKNCQTNPDIYQIGQYAILETVPYPKYTEATPVGSENPSALGWYERSGTAGAYTYTLSTDISVVSGKTYYTQTIINCGSVRMQLVGKNVDPKEGGSGYANTTWMAMDVLENEYVFNTDRYGDGGMRWENSQLRTFLNNEFFMNAMPKSWYGACQAVIKYSVKCLGAGRIDYDYPTVDRIWIPSYGEMNGIITGSETRCPHYSIMFDPEMPNATIRKTKRGGGDTYHYWLRTSKWNSDFYQMAHYKPSNDPAASGSWEGGQSYGITIGFCL